jgi:hypothetical protein
MMSLAMVVWANCGNIVLCISSAFAQRNYVVRLKKDISTCHCESGLFAVFARTFGAFESSVANRRIANVRHSRNPVTFHGAL